MTQSLRSSFQNDSASHRDRQQMAPGSVSHPQMERRPMGVVTVAQRTRSRLAFPHYLLINGQLLGIMKKDDVRLALPPGHYVFTVRSMYKFIETSFPVDVTVGHNVRLEYWHSERLWNLLFNIDLVLWVLKRFVTLPDPWDLVYEVLSNGFFVVWLIRTWVIRKRYFKFSLSRESSL